MKGQYAFFLVRLSVAWAVASFSASLAAAQLKSGEISGEMSVGVMGIRRPTSDIMREQAALSGQPPVPRHALEFEVDRSHLPQNPSSTYEASWPAGATTIKSPREFTPFSPQVPSLSFTGATLAQTGAFPPDVMGSVGPTQYIVCVNELIKSFTKATGIADGVLNSGTNTFFSSVMTPGVNFTSDPRIRYDRLSKRWFAIMIDVPGGKGTQANRVMIAMSDSAVITPGTVWTYFYFQGSSTQFADYPTLGIDANALYIGCNMFNLSNGRYGGTNGYVVRKSSLISGGPIVVTTFAGLASASGSGPFTPQGVDNFDTASTFGYFIGSDNIAFGVLDIRRVTSPGGTPTISSNISLSVPATDLPLLVPHKGNTNLNGTNGYLDAIDDRLFMAVLRGGKLWTVQNIGVSNTGIASNATRDGARWYELQNLDVSPSLVQSGTVYDPTAPNDGTKRYYWMPSVMVSGQGHVAMGFSTAGDSEFANGGTVGRLASDPAGTMQTPILYTASTTAYNPPSDTGGVSGRRWGDYSYTVVDPDDDMTMWTAQEFCNATNSYGVRVLKLLAPPPATPISCNPSSVSGGSTLNVTVTGSSSAGSGFFDPGAAFPHHIGAAISGTGITVNSVTYVSPTSATVNLTVALNASAGTRTVTVTNPDGQSATSATAILTVTGTTCPTITLSPATLPSGIAGTSYSQLITASGGKSPYTFAVTTGSLPANLTLTSGGLLSGTPQSGGTFNFSITATDSAGCLGQQAYTLTILVPTNPTGTGSATPTSVYPTQSTLLKVKVTPGTNPTSTGITVTGNLSGIGGAAVQQFYNDGTHGDAVAGDSIFSFLAIVSGGTSSGAKSLPITVADSQSRSSSTSILLTVFACQNLTIAPVPLPPATAGAAYSQQLSTSGGVPPYVYSIASGLLPGGVGMSSSGLISGVPATPGTSIVTVHVTDSVGCTGSVVDTLAVLCPPMSVSPAVLPTGMPDTPYVQTFTVSGGKAPYSFVKSSGSFPAGMTISSGGTLSGTPLASGQFIFTITATDSVSCTAARAETLFIQCPPMSINSATPPAATVNASYVFTFNVTGGKAPYHYSVQSGSLSPGLTVQSSGSITGTPKVSGMFHFTIGVVDTFGCTANRAESLLVQCPVIQLSSGRLPDAQSGHSYLDSVSASGGISTYHYAIGGGTLPAGLSLTSGGTITGTPKALGEFAFQVIATDSNGCSGTGRDTLTVLCPPLALSPSILPHGAETITYAETLRAAGGIAPYAFLQTGGSLPPGFTLSSGGVLGGFPQQGDSVTFQVSVTDSVGCTGSASYTLVIDSAAGMTIDISAAGQWNMLSNPTVAPNDSVNALFPGAEGDAFYYVSGSGYLTSKNMAPLEGYWLRFPGPSSFALSGKSILQDSIFVQDGWNLIGAYSQGVPVSSIIASGTSVTSYYFAYRAGYVITDSLLPGSAYWVKCSGAGAIIHPPAGAAVAQKSQPKSLLLPPQYSSFRISDGAGNGATLYLAGSGSTNEEQQLYELPPVPPPDVFDARFASQRWAEAYDTTRPSTLFDVQVQTSTPPIRLAWNNSGRDRFSIRRGSAPAHQLMSLAGSLTLAEPSTGEFQLQVEPAGFIPAAYRLFDSYPNPFNPATTIEYDLPEPSLVTIVVTNILGQTVKTLVDASADAGHYAVTWDGTTGGSGQAGSGVYFVRLQARPSAGGNAPEFSAVKKILLMK